MNKYLLAVLGLLIVACSCIRTQEKFELQNLSEICDRNIDSLKTSIDQTISHNIADDTFDIYTTVSLIDSAQYRILINTIFPECINWAYSFSILQYHNSISGINRKDFCEVKKRERQKAERISEQIQEAIGALLKNKNRGIPQCED